MEAIVLAGGFGTRLRPLTYTRAKPLLPILNKPMIVHLLDTLPKEVDKVILAVNYKKDQIEDYFNKNPIGKEIIVNDEPKPLGTGGATKFAEKHISGRFLVLNADVICSLDLSKMIKFHNSKNAMATISLWPVKNVSEFGVADVKDDGNIIGFVEKPKPEDAPSEFINAGAYCLEPEILDYIEKEKLVSMEKEIFPQIIDDTGRFYGFKFDGYWMDIGRITIYIKVHKFLMDKMKIDNYHGKNNKIDGKIKNSCIGNNVKIGNNSILDSTIVYDNAVVGNNTKLKGCVIGEKSIIGDSSILEDTVLGDNEKLENNTKLNNKAVWNQPKPKGYPDKQIGNPIEK